MKYLNNLSGWRFYSSTIALITFIISIYLMVEMKNIGRDLYVFGAIFVMPIFKNIWLKLTFCILCMILYIFFTLKLT